MADAAPGEDGRAAVPTHVVLTGTGDRRPPPGGSTGELDVRERAAVAALARAGVAAGIGWLTIQVASGAAGVAMQVRADLGSSVAVRVLGDPPAGDPEPVASGLTVVLADPGMGRAEIVHAVAAMAADGIRPEVIDEKVLAGYLFEPDVPDPDLVVVTGEDRRVPDLLMWEMAYSELVFLDAHWPAVDGTHLMTAIDEYRHRNRRYGGIATPARSDGAR